MIVSPTNVSVPLIAPSVNVQTEQAARDNKVREPVRQRWHWLKPVLSAK